MATSAKRSSLAPGDDAFGAVHEAHAVRDIVDTKEAIKSVDHDDAVELFAGTEDSFEYTDKEASWVRWKLDLILLTMVRPSKLSNWALLIYHLVNNYLYIFVYGQSSSL